MKLDRPALRKMQRDLRLGLLDMGLEIQNRAVDRAPYLTGALSNSIRVVDDDGAVYVKAGGRVGGAAVPYAKKREYENKAHPDRRLYLTKSFNSVVEGDWGRFFEGATK